MSESLNLDILLSTPPVGKLQSDGMVHTDKGEKVPANLLPAGTRFIEPVEIGTKPDGPYDQPVFKDKVVTVIVPGPNAPKQ